MKKLVMLCFWILIQAQVVGCGTPLNVEYKAFGRGSGKPFEAEILSSLKENPIPEQCVRVFSLPCFGHGSSEDDITSEELRLATTLSGKPVANSFLSTPDPLAMANQCLEGYVDSFHDGGLQVIAIPLTNHHVQVIGIWNPWVRADPEYGWASIESRDKIKLNYEKYWKTTDCAREILQVLCKLTSDSFSPKPAD